MPRLYDEADVFLNSSTVDNQPVSVLEAFAAGLPVVSTGTGAIADMVRPGETGSLVPPDDPEAMAAAVAALLESPREALRMTEHARDGCIEARLARRARGLGGSVPAGGRPALRAARRPPVAAPDVSHRRRWPRRRPPRSPCRPRTGRWPTSGTSRSTRR